ncbi:RNA polymerase sigma factor [Actinomadura monticuli]|uniref:Sigma-70 family RNA polymerase sigma factor n=1 Tax=Actinomadura monticuli TaxID=3097367 RepID=A0ABV4QFL1_9ACTN
MPDEKFEKIYRKAAEAANKVGGLHPLPQAERVDLIHTVTLKIIERDLANPQKDIKNLDGYIYTTMNNTLKKWNRRDQKDVPTEIHELQSRIDARQCDLATDAREQEIMVEQAIDKLPKKSREVLLCRFFGDMSAAEIAAFLGISESTVNRRIKKAKALLAPILGMTGAEETS